MLTVTLIICLVSSSYAKCEGNDATTCDDDNAVICETVFGQKTDKLRFETLVEQEFSVNLVFFRHCVFVL